MNNVDWPALANKVETQVLLKMEKELYLFDDYAYKAAVLKNASDGMKVCCNLNAGNWACANTILFNMDTGAREALGVMIAAASSEAFFEHFMKPEAWTDYIKSINWGGNGDGANVIRFQQRENS